MRRHSLRLRATPARFAPSPGTRWFARYVTLVTRHALEDFTCRQLTEEAQVAELHRLMRDGIYTALAAFEQRKRFVGAYAFVDYVLATNVDDGEMPQLLSDLVRVLRYFEQEAVN